MSVTAVLVTVGFGGGFDCDGDDLCYIKSENNKTFAEESDKEQI